MPATRDVLRAWRCKCNRCDAEWWSVTDELPGACAKCKSRYWNKPRAYQIEGAPAPKRKRRSRT